MTRETKVGLLVGLAFIIVIGILLSDYNRINPEPASLTAVSNDVNKGAATPHNGSAHDEAALPPAAPAAPAHPIPTREELHEQTTKIAIGPGAATPPLAAHDSPAVVADNASAGHADASPAAPTEPAANPNGNGALQQTARAHGEEIVSAGAAPGGTPPANPNPPPPTVNGARQYVAVSGDTLSKLAGRFLGGNTRANRSAIIALNPSLKQNPNNVIVGKTYMIPPRGTASGTAAAAPATPSAPVVDADRTPAPPSAAAAATFYTVKDNDSLWRIAEEELGDGTQWTKIRDANADVLKGGSSVRKNMKLRIPKKTVASAD